MMHKARSGLEISGLLFLKVIRQISRSQGTKTCQFLPKWGVFGLWLQFEFTNCYETMHEAWSRSGEVPHCFSMWSVKFPNWAFLVEFQFQFTDGYKMMHTLSRIEQVPHCSRSSIKFEGPTEQKIADFGPQLGVSGVKLPFKFTNGYEMVHKAWSRLGDVPCWFSRSSVKFSRSHGTNNRRFLTQIGRFRTVTPVWIHRWLWNDV